jgi:hypothetical protein
MPTFRSLIFEAAIISTHFLNIPGFSTELITQQFAAAMYNKPFIAA